MNSEQLAVIRERCIAASSGQEGMTNFLAHAREDVFVLIDAIEKLRSDFSEWSLFEYGDSEAMLS